MGTPTLVCVWSCPNFSAPAGRPFRCVSDIWLLISGDAKGVTVVLELMFAKTNEMFKHEMPRLVNLSVQKDREIAPTNIPELISKEFATHGPKMIEELFRKHMQNTTLNVYPITSLSTTAISTVDLQYQLYFNMKSKPQDQAADPELWEILKTKFEKP
ncbi:hypothetical protein Tco_1320958 [Tanacetum coccineum]